MSNQISAIDEFLVPPALPPVADAAPQPAAADEEIVADGAVRKIQGISTSKLLAPIQHETPKLGRKNGVSNLTASQKLDILNQLDAAAAAEGFKKEDDDAAEAAATPGGGEKATVTKLAAQYNISRQSIYRWKKEMPQLMEQAREQQMQGGDVAGDIAALASRKRGHEETLLTGPSEGLSASEVNAIAAVQGGGGGSAKKPTGEEYTSQQKLDMVRQLKANSKDGNKLRVRQFAAANGVNYRTLYRWIKSEDRLIELVEGEGMGNFKRTKFDGHLDRIKDALKVFVAHSNKEEEGGGEKSSKKITGRIIAEKAKQIKDEMLAQHASEPFLSADEVKAMQEFTGSQSWGRKMCRRFGWGNSSEGADKGGGKKTVDYDYGSGDEDEDMDEIGTPVDMTETDDPALMKLQLKKLKSDISFVKTKSGKFQKRVAKLEQENKSLRKQVEALKTSAADSEQVTV